MVKKIGIGLLLVLFFTYIGFIQYKVIKYSEMANEIKVRVRKEAHVLKPLKKDFNVVNKDFEKTNKEQEDLTKKIAASKIILNDLNIKITQRVKAIINSPGAKVAYLTFDDGPSGYTDSTLNILNAYGIAGTFFVNGFEDANSIRKYRRIVNEGHTIGNHCYSHAWKYIYSSEANFDNSFNQLQNLIKNTTGVTMNIMRFPGGSNNNVSNGYSPGIMDVLTNSYRNKGYVYFDWNDSSEDSVGNATNASVINNVISYSRGKSRVIILMHDSKATTPNTLATIIETLTADGFRFLPLSPNSFNVRFK